MEQTLVHNKSEHVKVKGHIGRWSTIDSKTYTEDDGSAKTYHLMEHETYGDEAAMLVLDSDGTVVLDDVWNGFDDLDYFLESEKFWGQEGVQ